jgi:hypothetical protein
MRAPRLLAALLAVPLVLMATPSAGLAVDVSQIEVRLSPSSAKFKRSSTLEAKFNAPYNLGDLPVAETYRLDVTAPTRSKCRDAVKYATAPDTVGELVTMEIKPKDVKPKGKAARWCEGTYRVQLTFEDPSSEGSASPPLEDESGPPEDVTPDGGGFGVDEYVISDRKFKVRPKKT